MKEAFLEVRELLNKVNIEDFRKKENWKILSVICEISPDSDILPLRSNYSEKDAFTIGINKASSSDNTSLWYTLPDLVADKFLSNKTPKIKKAIKFIPEGIQSSVKTVRILDNILVKPQDNIIKKLIDERLVDYLIKRFFSSIDKRMNRYYWLICFGIYPGRSSN